MFRSLKHRNFRLFFAGQGISLIGTWMHQAALAWLVYRITGSPLILGIVAFGGQIPALIISPFAGVLSDRWNRHRTIIITQILSMLQALALTVLAATGSIEVWHIIAIAFTLGVINAFDLPMRQAFMYHLVDDRADLPNAIALNSSLVNATRMIGPALAGVLIGLWSETVCFAVNALSYLAVIASLLRMEFKPAQAARETRSILHGLREGFAYAMGFSPIRDMLLLLAVASATAMMFTTLLPVFTRDVLHGDAVLHGNLLAVGGLGALAAALLMARRTTVLGLHHRIPLAAGLLSIGVFAFGMTDSTAWAMVWRFIGSFGIMFHMAACNTILQTIVDDGKRGRVMSFYSMAMMGAAPLGSLAGGLLTRSVGLSTALTIGASVCAAATLVFMVRLPELHRRVSPVYRELGIEPVEDGRA
jgi:MFS family permease